MTLPRKCVSLLLIYCFAIAVAPHPRLSTTRMHEMKQDEDEGLRFRLSEGTDQPEVRPQRRQLRPLRYPRSKPKLFSNDFRQSRASPATKPISHCARSHCRHHAPASRSCSHSQQRTNCPRPMQLQREHSKSFATRPKVTCQSRQT